MDDMFEREIKRSEIDDLSLCLIMIDIDRFKQFNDDFGHLAGDRVLVMVGEGLNVPLRPNDMVARYGGEEFSVMLPETTLGQAMMVAERLRERVASTDPGIFDGVQLPKVTISIGVAERKPGASLEDVIAAADSALYHAKREGRNCIKAAIDS